MELKPDGSKRVLLDANPSDIIQGMAFMNAALPDAYPGKITREDVEACLGVAGRYEGLADNSHDWSHRELQYEWERRAAKLAALLPPHPTIGGTGVEK